MAKPSVVKLNSVQKKSVLSKFKTTKNARKIAEMAGLPRLHVMAFLEDSGLRTYSEKSYS